MRWLMLAMATALAACGQQHDAEKTATEELRTYDVAAPPGKAGEGASPAAMSPQIAYNYQATYRVGGEESATVQDRHIALCRRLGPGRCRLLKSSTGAAGDRNVYVDDQTLLLVDARLAAAFNRELDAIAEAGGATVLNKQVETEDVTKQVIDTDARVRAKQALADRLFNLIRTGGGKVGDLVEAERAYAAAQEELEAARGALAMLRQRVRMSQVTITYTREAAGGALAPVRDSLRSAGDTLGTSLGALLTFAVAAAPWLLIMAGLVWLRRRMGWRWPLRCRVPPT